MRIKNIFTNRRSVHNFREDFVMNEFDFETIFELARYSPSIYNTQGVRYVVTLDKEKQTKVKELCHGQHKIQTASGLIIVLGVKDFLGEDNFKKVYDPMLSLNIIDKDEYSFVSEQLRTLRNSLTETQLNEEMFRNVFINVGFLLSIISVMGFDTCSMHAHNPDKIKELFNIPDDLEVLFLLPVGKAVDKVRPRGYKYRLGEILKFEKYE